MAARGAHTAHAQHTAHRTPHTAHRTCVEVDSTSELPGGPDKNSRSQHVTRSVRCRAARDGSNGQKMMSKSKLQRDIVAHCHPVADEQRAADVGVQHGAVLHTASVTATAPPQLSHSTATAQAQHSHSTATALPPHNHSTSTTTATAPVQPKHNHSTTTAQPHNHNHSTTTTTATARSHHSHSTCTFDPAPTRISSVSPRSTALNQTELSGPSSTCQTGKA